VRKFFLNFSLIVSAQFLTLAVIGQQGYWQQQVNYSIDVALNDKDHSLTGFEKIEYINNSPDTLHFIWFHLWPNAYKTDKTAYSDHLLDNGNTSFYFSAKEEKGYINRLDFKVNNITAATEDHPEHIDIVKVILPVPLAPSQKTIITTPFHVRLPYNFSRGGHDGESYQATQWYPKPAVYDLKGWHPMPYLDQGEFYSEFGNFDVAITVPQNYVVAATGELQDEAEKSWLQTRNTFDWKPITKKVKTKGGSVKTLVQKYPVSSFQFKTLHYKQDRVHDFAWFADKRFIVETDSITLLSGKNITVQSFYTPPQKEYWQNSIQYTKRTIQFYSGQIGDYPYKVVSVVQGPKSFGGGMEYPTITVISPAHSAAELETTIAHEVGHNWFYGILASNEREYPWMDEGINTFYENKYIKTYNIHKGPDERMFFETFAAEKLDQPITTNSQNFSTPNYGLVAYYKTAEWMKYLESQLGTAVFDSAMKRYYSEWQFKHPQPEDFKRSLEKSAGRNLDVEFALLDKKGPLPNQKRKGFKPVFLINPRSVSAYASHPSKNVLFISPAIGINSYDKLMLGALLTNVTLPPTRFQFLVTPMYATGSKKFAGLGFAKYSFYPDGYFRKIDLGLSGATFSMNEFKKTDGEKVYFGFQKLVPGIRLTLNEKNGNSTINRYIQWKSYFFKEESYRISFDTTFTPDTVIDQVVNLKNDYRQLNQLMMVVENFRALYPYRGELKLDQGKDFVRVAFTGNYFFNYSKKGGLDLRVFAGKFFYSGARTFKKRFDTDRYHLNMTGANGYEDYTYSDYFIGRNKFEGMESHQIMVRDGAFKIRTDLLGDKIGKTDDWLAAINLSTSIPSNINPLNLLPIKIPLKVFVDIGTYADAWERNANEDRFLWDAGFQIPLLKETVNIYIPVMYSRIFKDYVRSYLPQKNRFFRTISFSIDISHFTLHKINRFSPL
jgi:hypothetical protein